ncbi:MAG: hypothetical protein WCJ94_02830 [bacterium]
MKKIAVLFVFLFLISASIIAHPPSDIIITFDLKNRTVTANIMHDVKDILTHYIAQVVIMVNGKKEITQLASTQTSNDSQTVVYVIPGLKVGDVVSVDADCSKYGDLTKEAKVQEVKTNKQISVKKIKPIVK